MHHAFLPAIVSSSVLSLSAQLLAWSSATTVAGFIFRVSFRFQVSTMRRKDWLRVKDS
jgi:hypothetical protein